MLSRWALTSQYLKIQFNLLVPEKTYKNRQNYGASNDPPGIGISVNVPTPVKIEEKVKSVIKTLVAFQAGLVCFAL